MDVISPLKEIFNSTELFLNNIPLIRAIIGIILVFFAPGFAWTLIFFKHISRLERLVLSFALSITLVTLSILVLNALLDMKITGLNALLTIFLLIIIPVIIYYIRRYIIKRKMRQK